MDCPRRSIGYNEDSQEQYQSINGGGEDDGRNAGVFSDLDSVSLADLSASEKSGQNIGLVALSMNEGVKKDDNGAKV